MYFHLGTSFWIAWPSATPWSIFFMCRLNWNSLIYSSEYSFLLKLVLREANKCSPFPLHQLMIWKTNILPFPGKPILQCWIILDESCILPSVYLLFTFLQCIKLLWWCIRQTWWAARVPELETLVWDRRWETIDGARETKKYKEIIRPNPSVQLAMV